MFVVCAVVVLDDVIVVVVVAVADVAAATAEEEGPLEDDIPSRPSPPLFDVDMVLVLVLELLRRNIA